MAWKWLDNLRGIEGRVTELSGTVYLLRNDRIESADHRYSTSRGGVVRTLTIDCPVYRVCSYTGAGMLFVMHVRILPDGSIKAGCQYFDSPEADKIRKWALEG